MIHHVAKEYNDKESFDWPTSAETLMEAFEDDKPIADLYNAIFMTLNKKWSASINLNEHGFTKVESRNLANKIWSIASDWTALITGRKNAKQITLAMVIHRLTASKEGHGIPYSDVLIQNNEWFSSVNDMGEVLTGLMKEVVTHSSLDNNDMRQDTNTGRGTTHHTNFLIFQPNPPIDGTIVSNQESQFKYSTCEKHDELNKIEYIL